MNVFLENKRAYSRQSIAKCTLHTSAFNTYGSLMSFKPPRRIGLYFHSADTKEIV